MVKYFTFTTEEIKVIHSALLWYTNKLSNVADRLYLDIEIEDDVYSKSGFAYNTACKLRESLSKSQVLLGEKEVQIIYSALLSYGDEVRELNKLYLETETGNKISDIAKLAANTAVKVIDDKTEV